MIAPELSIMMKSLVFKIARSAAKIFNVQCEHAIEPVDIQQKLFCRIVLFSIRYSLLLRLRVIVNFMNE